MSKKLHRVTIDRSKWRCGGNGKHAHGSVKNVSPLNFDEPTLAGAHGQCCLGFVCRSYGVTLSAIKDVAMPSTIMADKLPKAGLPTLLKAPGSDSKFAARAAKLNDSESYTRGVRERKLIALARQYGEIWRFVGKYNN